MHGHHRFVFGIEYYYVDDGLELGWEGLELCLRINLKDMQ